MRTMNEREALVSRYSKEAATRHRFVALLGETVAGRIEAGRLEEAGALLKLGGRLLRTPKNLR